MEQIRKFLRDKGFALALLACLVAAAAAGVWAVRTVRDELDKNLSGLKTPDSTSTVPGIDEGLSTTTPQEDETTWEWPTEPAANSVSNVPKAASSASRSASSASSAPQAGSGSVREPSALQGASSPASSSAAPASTQPVSGRVLNGYSGDELVYNKTLGDWRTHEGIDINAQLGAPVSACAKGTVTDVTTDDMMGVTVTVDHGSGMESIYSNLAESVNVQVGSAVEAGTVLGTVGTSAISESASPSHLHFALREYGVMIDPLNYLH